MPNRKATLDSVVRQITTRFFFQNLACFLLLDAKLIIVMLLH